MKKIIVGVVSLLLIVCSVGAAFAAELQGGFYIVGDSALGSDLKFYVPSDYAVDSLTFDSDGFLWNLSGNSVYLYSPDFPSYTIYAPRFSAFQFRASIGSSYEYQPLNLTNVTDTNIDIMDSDPPAPVSWLYFAAIVIFILLCILIVRW